MREAMARIADFTLDASDLTWQEFVELMMEIKSASELGGVSAWVRPPRRCAAEAERVLRDLDLSDCVELVTQDCEAADARPAVDRTHRPGTPLVGYARLTRGIAALLGLSRGASHS